MSDILARNNNRRARATHPRVPVPSAPTDAAALRQAVPPARAPRPLPRTTPPDARPTPLPAHQPDALEDERILELPVRRRPDAAPPRGMLSLREAAHHYAAALPRPAAAAAAAPTRAPRAQAADVCPHCGGVGYVREDVPLGDPAFGKAIPCICKERLLEEKRRSDLRRLSSLDPFYEKTFATFEPSLPGMREAFEVAEHYAEDPSGWLVLRGGYGVGKTHLAAAIANYQLAQGTSVFFSIVPDLLDHLRAAFAPASEVRYDEMFDKIREAGLLVLDDLGAENSTAWATEKLFQLINYRYNFRMPTVVTTNTRLLSHMDERIRSRLSDVSFVRMVNIEAADYRERHSGRGPRPTGGLPRGRPPRAGR